MPYNSIFNHVGPISPLFCGGAIALGRLAGADDIAATRIAFMAACCLAVAAAALLVGRVSGSVWGGVAAGVTMLCFGPLLRSAASGPEKMVLVVFFELLALFALYRDAWLPAGAAIALAGLTWQGAWLLVPAFAIAAIGRHRQPWHLRQAVFLAGLAAPVVATTLVFAMTGDLAAFADGYVVFNARFSGAGWPGATVQVTRIVTAYLRGFGPIAWLLPAGLVALYLPAIAPGEPRGREVVTAARVAAPLFAVLGFVDFPSNLRLFPLFPLAALGLALTIARLASMLRRPLHRAALAALLALGCLRALALVAASPLLGLTQQRQTADRVLALYGRDARYATLGSTPFLALTKLVNPNRFVFFDRGIDRYIDAVTPGGFQAWGKRLLDPPPDVIVVGYLEGNLTLEFLKRLSADYEPRAVGPWDLLVRRRPRSR